mgnify:CR=1 FL=1
MKLVKQVEDTSSNKKDEKKDVVIGLDQEFVRNVFELHDKYLQYVKAVTLSYWLYFVADMLFKTNGRISCLEKKDGFPLHRSLTN